MLPLVEDEIGVEALSRAVAKIGASRAKLIKASDVVVRDWVRFKCQYGCPNYGQYLTCPPRSPTPDQTRKILSEYDQAILLEFKQEKKEKPINEAMVRLEREVFLSGYPTSIGLSAGPCRFCEKCDLTSCAHPQSARPSLEACGIDVFSTARKAGFEINVIQNRKQKPTRIGLLLVK